MTEQRVIYLKKPGDRKVWGIGSSDKHIIPELNRAANFAANDSPMCMSSERVVNLWERMAAGFPHAEYNGYGNLNPTYADVVFVAFYASEDIALDAALAMADYIGCTLEME